MANNTGQKFGGRKKGTPNKLTSDIRDSFSVLINNNIDKLQGDLNSLNPKDRIKAIMELAKYVIPSYKPMEPPLSYDDKPLEVTIDFRED